MTKIIETVAELQSILDTKRKQGKKIGFVPTMGALHSGHMTLIGHAVEENDITVCSIFVNPTQFNEKSDLDKYPRTVEADVNMLKQHKADYAFVPTVKEIYPNSTLESVKVDLEGLDKQMEGAFRPGHFKGVVQVVHRLLDIVHPDRLYMGQKDFQQFTIIAKMIDNLKMSVQLRVVPIVRAEDGLAMSSRNVRLPENSRAAAPKIHKALKAVHRRKYKLPVAELEAYVMQRLTKEPLFEPEYFTIVDGYTLTPIQSVRDSDYVVGCTAVWTGGVRLIDNVIYRKPKSLNIFVK